MKFCFTLFLLFILLVATSILKCAEDGYRLTGIRFSGNKEISTASLRKDLSLKSAKLYHKIIFWKEPPLFNELLLAEDLQILTKRYQENGFLAIDIDVDREIDHPGRRLAITFNIHERKAVKIAELDYLIYSVTTVDSLIIRDLIMENEADFAAKPGTRFQDNNIRKTTRQIINLLQENGFPEPKIEFEIRLIAANTLAQVRYEIDPGPLCKFGDHLITGNERISDKTIEKQIYFAHDQLYNFSGIEETQRRIQQLGVFQIVTIRTLMNEIVDGQIPIEINVRELPAWSVRTGIGYGLEDRFRISANIQGRGFPMGAQRTVLNIKHSYLEPYNLNLKIIQPAFPVTDGSLILNPFLRKERESAYQLKRYGVSSTLQWNPTNLTTTFFSYRFERNYLDLESDTEDENGELYDEYYNKSSVSAGLSLDNSTPPFFPERGFYASIVSTLSGLKLKSRYHYLQGLIDLRKYQTVYSQLVLAGKIKLGSIKPIWGDSRTPIEERFFAGGSSSIRGWERGDIGPRNEFDNPVGGNSYLEFSLELRHLIWNIIYGVLFLDGGNIWSGY
ncbi:MAG: BamA/TamA family outer membrane protein, partial [Candidatus Cloacimonetes bacterium]|nr:BamA/TamA family outer membrane protein [Candidatus Cloacimonadota bacterium]